MACCFLLFAEFRHLIADQGKIAFGQLPPMAASVLSSGDSSQFFGVRRHPIVHGKCGVVTVMRGERHIPECPSNQSCEFGCPRGHRWCTNALLTGKLGAQRVIFPCAATCYACIFPWEYSISQKCPYELLVQNIFDPI